jgi:hypothetical protein
MIDLNVSPYHDDFDERKGFYKILFRPGYAVQARELTQLQTLLQNQISKFGNHIFKDGSVVIPGGISTASVNYVKVLSTDVSVFLNTEITGGTSGAKAYVVAVSNNIEDNISKIYFTYTNGIPFQQNENIANSVDTFTLVDETSFTGTATAFSIGDSVYYVNGFFVFCEKQTTIIGTDDTSATARVGLQITEDIVSTSDDETLLDPARGTFNFSAPGANRYSITLTLTSFDYTPSDEAADNTSENFIELARYVYGTAVYVNQVPIYSELENTLARRTYDESGDYTVKSFGLKVEPHVNGDNTLLSLRVEPGKAYVRGYEFETIAPTYLDLSKARTAILNNEFPITIDYGQFVYIQNPNGAVDYTANPVANLYNNINLSAANIIGTARIKHIDYDSTVGSNTIFKLYIDDVQIGANAIATLRTVAVGTNVLAGAFVSNVNLSSYSANTVTLTTAENLAYITELPKQYVANIIASETSYESLKVISDVTFTSNTVLAFAGPINISSPHQFDAGLAENTYIVTVTSVLSGTIPVGLRLEPSDLEIEYVSGTSINISYTGGYSDNSTFVASITAPTVVVSPTFKTKTLTSGTKVITGGANIAHWANLIQTSSLDKSDIFTLTSVLVYDDQANVFSYSDYYDLDNGQTDISYDHGSVTLKTGYVSPAFNYSNVAATIYAANTGNIANVTFNFDYFTHTGEGVLTVDSYTNSGIEYTDIPIFASSTGRTYNLRDSFDFRPRQNDGATAYSSGSFGAPGTRITTDFFNYIGRKARLVLTKERKLTVVDGVADEFPVVPLDVADAMSLYLIDIAPYTATVNDVTFQYIDNRRYTMRDIGRIERRIEKLEYYTALSLLEKTAKDESIVDPGTTLDRFKNGIVVDSFAGHSVGDVSNPKYECSIDYENRVLRPRFSSQSFNFKLNSGSGYIKRDDLITLDYTTETFLNQPLASTWVNLNPYFVFNWNGVVTLNPATDTWVDTYTKPDVVVNLNGENDVFTQLVPSVTNPAASGVRWNDWQTIVNGTPQVTNALSTSTTVGTQTVAGRTLQTTTTTTTNTTTTTVNQTVARVGAEISTGATRTITRDIGTRIVDTSIVPFIRTKIVDFSAKSLKPSTTLNASFDGIDVTQYCVPATQITITGTIPSTAKTIRLTSNASVSGRIIMSRPDRVFVSMREGLIYGGNAVTFLSESGSSIGTATANTVIYSTDTGTISGNVILKTNELGDIAGAFVIPNTEDVRFRTGEREFKLYDAPGAAATTAAAAKYVAQGMSQSTERTIVATRVASVSINPVLEIGAGRTTTTQSTAVVGTQTNTVDITPPPPPAPPLPQSINCGQAVNGNGRVGRQTFTLNFGSDIGSCGINYNAFSVPDRYTIIWNGQEYTTGFVGSSSFNSRLRALGFPDVVGSGSGQLRFNKTLASPSTATLIVDAPISGTAWSFTGVCPTSNIAPTPTVSGSVWLQIQDRTIVVRESGARPPVNIALTPLAVSTLLTVRRLIFGNITSPRFARISGLTIDSVTDNATGAAIAGVTLTSSSVDATFSSITGAPDWSTTLAAVPQINALVPANRGGSYTIRISGTVTLYTDSARTVSSGITASASGRITIFRDLTPGFSDPVAQTFFVDAEQYPNGVFVDSLDLYFRSKSSTLPVTVQIRPTVNGYPSSVDVLPFATSVLSPDDITISTTGTEATNFKFDAPVYLAPGEYSFVVLCNTTEYEIFTARIGDNLLADVTKRITTQPAIGSMFKSQNASTWTPIQEEDIQFKLNKCVFETDTPAVVTLDTDIPSGYGTVPFDVFYASGETVDFAATNIEYYYKTTDTSNNADSFVRYQAGSNVSLDERKHVRSTNPSDLQMQVVMSTENRDISPVVDLNRLSSVLVQNIVNNDSTNETLANSGNAVARYINRKVTLAPGFESLDLKAYLLANLPTSTSIKVYYKVASVYDPFFEDNEWQEMVVESAGTPSETGWVEYKYKTSTDTALANGDRFKTFAIKIVMLSSDTTKVPQIRDLRVIALDD